MKIEDAMRVEKHRLVYNHRIGSVTFLQTPNTSGFIRPVFIVMHYTATWTAASAIDSLRTPAHRASAHVVVDIDGTVTQLADFNIATWHAGPSSHAGYSSLNNHSIGIEIANIGYLRRASNNRYIDAYGGVHQEGQGRLRNVPLIEAPNARVGGGTFFWPAYPDVQLKAVEQITEALVKSYPIIDVLSHEQIDTRGWKTDPGPAFPMNRFRSFVNDRNSGENEYIVTASSLNVRYGPGTRFSIARSLPKGTQVGEIAAQGDWVQIDSDSWVHKGFLRRVN